MPMLRQAGTATPGAADGSMRSGCHRQYVTDRQTHSGVKRIRPSGCALARDPGWHHLLTSPAAS